MNLNGQSENGIKLNGVKLNGDTENGIRLNGVKLNGDTENGRSLNGRTLNGRTLNGVSGTSTAPSQGAADAPDSPLDAVTVQSVTKPDAKH